MVALQDRVIVITGASSGIGAATALASAEAGLHVLLTGRDAARLDQVAAAVRQRGRRAECVAGDVAEAGLAGRLLDAAEQRLGGFYAVFANAGYGFKKPLHLTGEAELRAIFEVNFFAANALLCEAARRLLAARQPGHLLHCSSAVGKFALANFAAYSATKAAQNHAARAMNMELRPRGIFVSSVHPVTTRTDFFDRANEFVGRRREGESAFAHVPGWMLQRPEQVARAVVRCLRRPRPEVWTSPLTRLAAGLMTIFPRLMDVIGARVPE
jgi:short-subunit dehydrogenase